MTLHLHRAERADTLVAALGELLAAPPADVFAPEVVAVPARGVERWITQQLSHRLGPRPGREDGVCAGIQFPSPGRLIADVMGLGDHDPWAPDSLVWPLLRVIDESAGQPWSAMLDRHLGQSGGTESANTAPPFALHDELRRGRRYAVARRLAGLFHSYSTDRPELLDSWAAGTDLDGFGRPLPPDLRWEAELWRRVRDELNEPDPVTARLQVIRRLVDDGPAAVSGLPPRLSLFGPTRLPPAQLDVLAALAVHRDVHLWLPHPSPALWQRLTELDGAELDRAELVIATEPRDGTGLLPRRADPTVTVPRHPLLASLGRDVRELQLVVTGAARPAGISAPEVVDHHHRSAEELPGTLLGLLQQQLRDDEPAGMASAELPAMAADDRSVRVYSCHGAHRQVEVLRDALVGLLDRDPTLEPRDILVMCPDIEAYAPLIAASFGLADVVTEGTGHPGHRLRVRLADRALHQTNPLLATVGKLLSLADGRVTASDVLDLAAWGPVRRRFGFDDDALDRLRRWVIEAGVRWGLDAPHRRGFKLEAFNQNTWRAGLDRILLGVAMADEQENILGVALPLDDVGSGDVDLAGRFAELLDRLQVALDALTGRQPLDAWLQALTAAVGSLTRVTADESWQSTEVRRELADIADGADDLASSTQLSLTDVRSLLRGRLAGRPTRANFRTGTLTVCTMVPMRSVPHRVVCLLGLDDGVFPRNLRPDGDDILTRTPAVGERDPRGEDRQLMLDAILAATEHLVITYTGADERLGAHRPPAVPLGELLDALDLTARTADGAKPRSQVLVRQPLQPFDARNFTREKPSIAGDPGPFSYDPAALAGARAAAGARTAPPPFLAEPLPAKPERDVELAELIALLTHPARGFLRQRLDVAVRYDEEDPQENLSVTLDALAQWGIGDRLVQSRLAGMSEQACRQAEWRRGVLPPGPLGLRILDEVLLGVEPLVERTAQLRAEPRRTVDVSAPLPSGRQVRGSVPGVHGTRLVLIGYSKLGVKAQLTAWIQLLALIVAHPETPWSAVAVGRGQSPAPRTATFAPLELVAAQEFLTILVDLFDRGQREPLPLPLKTSHAYAKGQQWNPDPAVAMVDAGRVWKSDKFPGEDADHSNIRIWGPKASIDRLARDRPHPDERWAGEQSRFGELSRRLWTPVLEHAVGGSL